MTHIVTFKLSHVETRLRLFRRLPSASTPLEVAHAPGTDTRMNNLGVEMKDQSLREPTRIVLQPSSECFFTSTTAEYISNSCRTRFRGRGLISICLGSTTNINFQLDGGGIPAY